MNHPPSSAQYRGRFVLCAILLFAIGVGGAPAIRTAQRKLAKRPIPARRLLKTFDVSALSDFFEVEIDFSAFTLPDVGTDDWFEKSVRSRSHGDYPGAASTSAYYYPVTEIKLPHTPETCYRLSGFTVTDITIDKLTIDSGDGPRQVPVCRLNFSMNSEDGPLHYSVLYTFCINGRYFADRDLARAFISLPWNRSLYLSKIECSIEVIDPDQAGPSRQILDHLMAETIDVLLRDYFPRM